MTQKPYSFDDPDEPQLTVPEEKVSKTKKAKSAFKRFVRNMLILILVLLAGTLTFLHFGTYSTGQRAGSIIEISKRGAVFKTYEGRMNILNPGAPAGSGEQLRNFEFSVRKKDAPIIEKLEAASLSGERVQLRFEEKYVALPWRGETKYFVTEVKRMGDEAEQ